MFAKENQRKRRPASHVSFYHNNNNYSSVVRKLHLLIQIYFMITMCNHYIKGYISLQKSHLWFASDITFLKRISRSARLGHTMPLWIWRSMLNIALYLRLAYLNQTKNNLIPTKTHHNPDLKITEYRPKTNFITNSNKIGHRRTLGLPMSVYLIWPKATSTNGKIWTNTRNFAAKL